MKNKLIIWLIVLYPLNLFGQNIDSLIRNIRSEYNLIVKNKDSYKKTVLNINLYDDDDEGDNPLSKEKAITYYMDETNNQIKLISIYEASYMYSYYTLGASLTEYYLKDGNPFFIFQQSKGRLEVGSSGNIEDILTKATEHRIYTVGNIDYQRTYVSNARYYSINNCIKYLVKSVEGKLSDTNDLLQKTANTEIDCSKSTEKEIDYSVKDLVDIYYGRNKSVKIESKSNEIPLSSHYYVLFEDISYDDWRHGRGRFQSK